MATTSNHELTVDLWYSEHRNCAYGYTELIYRNEIPWIRCMPLENVMGIEGFTNLQTELNKAWRIIDEDIQEPPCCTSSEGNRYGEKVCAFCCLSLMAPCVIIPVYYCWTKKLAKKRITGDNRYNRFLKSLFTYNSTNLNFKIENRKISVDILIPMQQISINYF